MCTCFIADWWHIFLSENTIEMHFNLQHYGVGLGGLNKNETIEKLQLVRSQNEC